MSVGHNSLLKLDLCTLYMSMGAGESFKSFQKSTEEEYMLNGVLWSQAVGRGSGYLHPGQKEDGKPPREAVGFIIHVINIHKRFRHVPLREHALDTYCQFLHLLQACWPCYSCSPNLNLHVLLP